MYSGASIDSTATTIHVTVGVSDTYDTTPYFSGNVTSYILVFANVPYDYQLPDISDP